VQPYLLIYSHTRPYTDIRPYSVHAPTGVHLTQFGRWDDPQCRLCAWTAPQVREHLSRHVSPWRDQPKPLSKAVRMITGWNAARCRHLQVSGMFSTEECDDAVVHFLAATGDGEFLPKWMEPARSGPRRWLRCGEHEGSGRRGHISSLFSFLFVCFSVLFYLVDFICQWGWSVAGGGAPPSSRLAWRRRGYKVLSYSSKCAYSMNKQQQQ